MATERRTSTADRGDRVASRRSGLPPETIAAQPLIARYTWSPLTEVGGFPLKARSESEGVYAWTRHARQLCLFARRGQIVRA